jgi:hypothetical protein
VKEDINIKKVWKSLLIPFSIGCILFITALLFMIFGSKKPLPQVFSLFGVVFGATLIIAPLSNIIKVRKYLKSMDEN